MKTKTVVWCRFDFEAFHHWPAAPEEVSFLRAVHRHRFHVKAAALVEHDDRDVEFILLQRELRKTVARRLEAPLSVVTWSCEHWARFLLTELELEWVEVSEDQENGAIVVQARSPGNLDRIAEDYKSLCDVNRAQWSAIEGLVAKVESLFGLPTCTGCGKPIGQSEELLRRIDTIWHRACLEESLPSPKEMSTEGMPILEKVRAQVRPAEPDEPSAEYKSVLGPDRVLGTAQRITKAPPHKIVARGDGLRVITYACVCGLQFGENESEAIYHANGLPF